MKTAADYTALIEPQHADKPRFVATVGLTADVMARFQTFLASMPAAFDLDNAVGVQLDADGVRAGRSRTLSLPLPSPWFTLDNPNLGLDRGIWKGVYDEGDYLSSLDDETYRRLLRAKVLANRWDGSLGGLEAIYAAYFQDPATLVFVQDPGNYNLTENWFTLDDPQRGLDAGVWQLLGGSLAGASAIDMSITVGIAGKVPLVVDLGLLGQNLVGAKPEGVRVDQAVTSIDGAALFGFDLDNACVAGLDVGAWGVSPAYAIANTPLL